jgi:probable F420-dependent oxidoreductase
MQAAARTVLGRLGVWTHCDGLDHTQLRDFARKLESWGYSALWQPEAVGRDPFAVIAYLAGQTERLVFATGIANIYARDAVTMKAIHKTLAEMLPDRFVLGLGVSHANLVSKLRGHEYKKPIPAMREFLDSMDRALYLGREPERAAPVLLAALRPAMLKLAAERTQGAHPYLVPVEHTVRARALLGPESWLCPELMVLGERDAGRARALARQYLKVYLRLPNYQLNLREYGFGDSDFDADGSDALIDALIAWGDLTHIRARIAAHFSAGADHVCIQALRTDGLQGPDLALLEALAPGNA